MINAARGLYIKLSVPTSMLCTLVLLLSSLCIEGVYAQSSSGQQAVANPKVLPASKATIGSLQCPNFNESQTGIKERSKRLRIASWGLRWFRPALKRAARTQAERTKAWRSKAFKSVVDVVACELAELDADIIAIQGLRKRGMDAFKQVSAQLSAHTKAPWKMVFDSCDGKGFRHLGLMYRSDRVKASDVRVEPSINPKLKACADGLRPGIGGTFSTKSGESVNVYSLHLTRGNTAAAHARRVASLLGIARAEKGRSKLLSAARFVALGVYNFYGCKEGVYGCVRPLSPRAEKERAEEFLERAVPPMVRVTAESAPAPRKGVNASAYMLDGVVLSKTLGRDAQTNYRYGSSCRKATNPSGKRSEKYQAIRSKLTDRCPFYIDL